jgi:hypothetical protein
MHKAKTKCPILVSRHDDRFYVFVIKQFPLNDRIDPIGSLVDIIPIRLRLLHRLPNVYYVHPRYPVGCHGVTGNSIPW